MTTEASAAALSAATELSTKWYGVRGKECTDIKDIAAIIDRHFAPLVKASELVSESFDSVDCQNGRQERAISELIEALAQLRAGKETR